jgi:hypothetical protein
MNLRRNLLATAITSLLCFSQNTLADSGFDSTITLNHITRTVHFDNPSDATNFGVDSTSNPNPNAGAQLLDFATRDANGNVIGTVTTATGLITQTDLNGVPMIAVPSGRTAVIAQPNLDGTIGFITLKAASSDALGSVIQAYSDVAQGKTPSNPSLLDGAVFAGVDPTHAALFNDALTSAKTAKFENPVTVAAGGTPSDNNDSAAILKSLQSQNLLKTAAISAPTNGSLTATTASDLTAIINSTLVQLNAAAANLNAATTVAADVANDPTLASLAQANLAVAQSADAAANLAYLNDPTAHPTDAQITSALTSIVTSDLAILNNSAASVADKEAAKSALDALLVKYPTNSYLMGESTAIQTAETVFANDKSIAAEVAILSSTTATSAEKAAALQALKTLLSNPELTDAQKLAIQTDLATYGVPTAVTNALAVLNGTATGNKATALKDLEKAYDSAKKDLASTDSLKKIQAQAVLDAIAGKVASAELINANSALSSAMHRLENTKTAGQIISARQALQNAEGSAVKSTKYKDLSVANAASAGTTALSAAQVQAQAQTALANTGTAEYWARNTSANGIAGNPSSMLNMTADHMFSQGADVNNMTSIASGTSSSGMQHSINAGLQYNYYNLAGTNVNTVSLPLSYTTQINSKSQVILSVPLSYISQNKNDTYQIGAGVAFKYNATDRWSLTPAFSYSYRTADTTDYNTYYAKRALGDGVSVMGGGLTSKYDWDYNDIKISMTNMGGYFAVADGFGATSPLALGYSNDLGNFVLKNGVSVGKSVNGFGVTTYLNDAEYFGSKVFFDQYNEFGFALKPENMGALNAFSVNANYLFSFKGGKRGDLDGFKVNLNYKF